MASLLLRLATAGVRNRRPEQFARLFGREPAQCRMMGVPGCRRRYDIATAGSDRADSGGTDLIVRDPWVAGLRIGCCQIHEGQTRYGIDRYTLQHPVPSDRHTRTLRKILRK